MKGHWNSFSAIYGQITYWNSNFLFSNLRLVILNNIVYTFYNAKLFAVLPCFHLKQNGLNQVIVTQTSAVFLHMENSYYSGEAVYQEGKKKNGQKSTNLLFIWQLASYSQFWIIYISSLYNISEKYDYKFVFQSFFECFIHATNPYLPTLYLGVSSCFKFSFDTIV